MDGGNSDRSPGAAELTALELWLGEGAEGERAALRQRIANDPLQAIEMAETVALLEEFRQVRVESSARLHCKLADVVRRAGRRVAPTGSNRPWVAAGWTVAAAAVVLGVLRWFDPLGAPAGRPALVEMRLADAPPREAGAPVEIAAAVRPVAAVQWESTVERMRQRLGIEGSRRLGEALELGLRDTAGSLERWLDPRNALARLNLEYERRGSDEERAAAVRRAGAMVGIDERTQQIADQVALDLVDRLARSTGEVATAEVAFAVRALIAAGATAPQRRGAVALGGRWLAERVDAATGAELVEALAALVEVAAVTGEHAEAVRSAGRGLVDGVLHADDDTWGRWRPELLAGRMPAATLADAARVLGLLPGLGVDAERCHLVRRLVLGQLRERRDQAEGDGPEVLAAMVFGCVDLLADGERDEVERQLRRWSVTRLVPDYRTVLQIVWSLEPGRLGFTRLQRDLRRLAVTAEPRDLFGRAAFCLCLLASYADRGEVGAPGRGLGV